ncbi:MAG: hypothetical protein P4L00_06545 [Candidatus Acidoferrales bacterium]|nr:hypothetical protein [Candidatus Acidoferrales bacterium]
MPGITSISALALTTALLAGAVLAQDRIADLRARLAREPSPVSKAKLMPELGDAEFAEIDTKVTQGHMPEAIAILRIYRDEVDSCNKGLDATGVDAEKHPGGFKQLQISLRESLRRLDAVIVNMTSDEQAPFLDVRKDLSDVNRRLIQRLFPHELPAKPEH